MALELVVATRLWGTCGALLGDGRLIQLEVAEPLQDGAVGGRGEIHLGRVRRVDRDLGAAFVDCGLDRDGYLARRDARGLGPLDRLAEGAPILVQITRAAEGDKGPRLTTDLALLGLLLLHRPKRRGLTPSERLSRRAGRGALGGLRERITRLLPGGGFVLRSAALDASDAELAAEGRRLATWWREIETRVAGLGAPACVHAERDPESRLLVALAHPELDRIIVDTAASAVRARRHLERRAPTLAARIEHQPGAFEANGVGEQLAAALEPVVPLDGGGRLIVQPTAALTAIDVDGGGRRALDVDLAAAAEVARQLRLRRIGGTVVVDFVDLDDARARAALVATLRAAVADDPVPTQVMPMTAFGLVPIGRRRTGPSLAEALGRVCPLCAGDGIVASLDRRGDALRQALAGTGRDPVIARVAPDLATHLDRGGGRLASALVPPGRRVALRTDPSLPPGGFALDMDGAPDARDAAVGTDAGGEGGAGHREIPEAAAGPGPGDPDARPEPAP